MSAPITDDLASRLRAARRAHRAHQEAGDHAARALVLVAFAIPVAVLITAAVIALAVLLMAQSGLTGLGSAVAGFWLAVHQVPLTVSGVTIGVLPLLPTMIVVAGAARMTASAAADRADPTELLAVGLAAIGGPMLVTAISLAVVMDGSSVLPIQSPNPLLAFGYTLGLHGGAALAGIAWDRRRQLGTRLAIGPADRRGLRYGTIAVIAFLAAGAALVVVRLVLAWGTVGALMADGYDFDGMLGLLVMSLLYLPNLIIGAAAVLVGSDAHIGGASVDLFAARGGAVPPLPVLGILPDGGLGYWGLLGLIVPMSVAVFVALRCRDLDPMANFRSVAVAAALATTLMVIGTAMAGGELGELGDAAVNVTSAGVFTLGWILVVGFVVGLIHTCLPSTRAARERVHGFDDFDDWADEFDGAGFEDDYLTDEHYADQDYADEGYDADEDYDIDEDFVDADRHDEDRADQDLSDEDQTDENRTHEDEADQDRDTAVGVVDDLDLDAAPRDEVTSDPGSRRI